MPNQAAWITEPKGNPLQVKEAPMPKAGKGEVVIKNHAVAVNPVDWKVQDYGVILQKYPNVLGTDVAGEIYEVGEGVTEFKRGDRVIGHAFSLLTNDPTNGGFALYTACNATVVSKIPSTLDYNSATVLPLAISTAATCLFKTETLALPLPTSNPTSTGRSILVWGGSSSVGAAAIQLAAAAGVKVVSVASKHNVEKVKSLGAAAVFDYNSNSTTDDILSALEGTEYAGVCDAIGTPASVEGWAPVYEKLGGRYGTVLPDAKDLPEGIQGGAVFAISIAFADKFIGDSVWGKWVPEALETGALKALPPPIVIKGGLESGQKGLDAQKKGVSFGKIVIEL
ncbi:oxidoreductase-like protein [Plenodomus tracheiphilus IPT5]|uniref:Oxidoreductase-like protein n=1 Tax=Plenodomus tracheiphilus IPT5 TaxID=1408161 RepID=A0A6A7BBB4_9PLEO|nr:oxidoreductase-like protein [Plenodomus tracheiphilus IPT5]